MSVELRNVTFLNAGKCRQLAYLAGRASLQLEDFYAVFVYFEHPTAGPSLIDTGYSEAFWHATRRIPERFHRWATPVTMPAEGSPDQVLESRGISPSEIQRVFVSHFHADHIGGLSCFPESKFIYREDALSALRLKSRPSQVHHGFLAELLPQSFEQVGEPLALSAFENDHAELPGFETCNYFGDASLLLVDLPGHALGHTGFLLRTTEGPLFYIVDACWDVEVMARKTKLPWLSRFIQHNFEAYTATQEMLLANQSVPQIACHCPKTQDHVATT